MSPQPFKFTLSPDGKACRITWSDDPLDFVTLDWHQMFALLTDGTTAYDNMADPLERLFTPKD